MLCGQSKLKSIVANMALQHIKTIEAATIKETESCKFELMQLLIILNLVMTLGNSISLEQNQFSLGTQAFTSPPDMALSGVWENIILTKTPALKLCVECYTLLYF